MIYRFLKIYFLFWQMRVGLRFHKSSYKWKMSPNLRRTALMHFLNRLRIYQRSEWMLNSFVNQSNCKYVCCCWIISNGCPRYQDSVTVTKTTDFRLASRDRDELRNRNLILLYFNIRIDYIRFEHVFFNSFWFFHKLYKKYYWENESIFKVFH